MTGDVIKSFLVSLGFDVDDSSLAKFNKSIATATARVGALYVAAKAMAAGVAFAISKVSEGFEQMGYEYRIIAPAINKALLLRREMLRAYSAAGINITKVVQESVKLNFSLAKTKFAFEAIYKSVAAKFFPMLTKQSDNLRKAIYANMPKIQASLEKFVKFVFKFLEASAVLGQRVWSILTRVYDFFYKLHEQTQGWSTIILGLVAAWQLLNLSFLATPLGMILTGLLAILALYDDFMTFKEGGKSLFDWTSFLPVIESVTKYLAGVRDVLDQCFTTLWNIIYAFKSLFSLDFSGFFNYLKEAGLSLLDVYRKALGAIMSFVNVGKSAGSWVAGLLGAADTSNVAANMAANPVAQPLNNPLGAGVANSQTNQNVQQQTSINVTSGADANAVGKAVAGEQTRVNFDMVRNLRGATR